MPTAGLHGICIHTADGTYMGTHMNKNKVNIYLKSGVGKKMKSFYRFTLGKQLLQYKLFSLIPVRRRLHSKYILCPSGKQTFILQVEFNTKCSIDECKSSPKPARARLTVHVSAVQRAGLSKAAVRPASTGRGTAKDAGCLGWGRARGRGCLTYIHTLLYMNSLSSEQHGVHLGVRCERAQAVAW